MWLGIWHIRHLYIQLVKMQLLNMLSRLLSYFIMHCNIKSYKHDTPNGVHNLYITEANSVCLVAKQIHFKDILYSLLISLVFSLGFALKLCSNILLYSNS